MWSDYLPPDWIEAFQGETGITLNYTGIGSNEEIINKMKATKGRGIDICSPTNVRSGQWVDLELLQPWDYGKIPDIDKANPAMLKVGDTEWNFGGKGSHWLPHIWGTEAIGWRTDLYAPPGGIPSYGNIWDPEVKGKTMIRPHSGMLGAGLYMETIGELEPGAVWSAYESEEKMRPVWEKITAYCIKNKDQVKLFWNDDDSQKNGFLNDGVIVGQTWDGPPLALKTAGEPVTYQAPKEGALAWVDGMSLSADAGNLEQAYAFIEFCYRPEPAGKAIDKHGYNSAVMGADQYAGDSYKKNFAEAYPGDALANLNPWPAEPQWYADVRTEYENKFVSV
jgi:spermidine/putrescine transport system substrate-binding protein